MDTNMNDDKNNTSDNLVNNQDMKDLMRKRRQQTMKTTFENIENYKEPEKQEEVHVVKKDYTEEELVEMENKKRDFVIDSFISSIFDPLIQTKDTILCSVDSFISVLYMYLKQERSSNNDFILLFKCYNRLLSKRETLQYDYLKSTFSHCQAILEGALYSTLMKQYTLSANKKDVSLGSLFFSIYDYVEYSHSITDLLKALYSISCLYNTTELLLDQIFMTFTQNAKEAYKEVNMNRMQLLYVQLYDIISVFPQSYEYIKQYLNDDLKCSNGFILQNLSFFGPLLGLHPISPNLAIVLFRNNLPDHQSFNIVYTHCIEVMKGLQDYHMSLFKVLKLLLKSSVTKSLFLQWIEHVILLNTDYMKIKYDRMKLSSFGFLATLAEFLYVIIEPLKNSVTKININYATDMDSPLYAKEDRIQNKNQHEENNSILSSKETYSSATLYFFYFCSLYSRVFIPLFDTLERYERYINSICPDGIETYMYSNEEQHRSFSSAYIMSQAIASYLFSPSSIYMNMNITTMICKLILNSVSISSIEELHIITNDTIKSLPIRLLTILINANKYISINVSRRSLNKVIPDSQYYSYLLCTLTFLLNQSIQIHIEADLAEALYTTFLPSKSQETGASMTLSSTTVLPHYIIPSLIRIYGNVGTVGDMSISYRRGIAVFLREIWNMKGYHEDIINIQDNRDIIINFAFGLISTFSNVIAETFSSIPLIKSMYKEMNSDEFSKLSEDQRDDKLLQLKRTESRVKNSFLLADETLKLFKDAAEEWHEVWMDDKLRDFLASSLATILSQLVGKEGVDLKLEDPDRYHFHPNEFLSLLIEVILCFNKDDQFAISILNSGQNLVNSFTKAERIVRRLHLLSNNDLISLHTFIKILNKESTVVQDLTELIDEAPSEYIDIITGDFMKDPVQLPVTNQIVDRTTIEHALLTNPVNPFNRQPLTKEQLIPQPELKQQILQWLKDHNASL